MNHVQFVSGDQRLLALQREFPEIRPCERCILDQFIQRLARDQFHDDVWAVLIGTDIIDGDNMRMLERCQSSGLFHELPGGLLLKLGITDRS